MATSFPGFLFFTCPEEKVVAEVGLLEGRKEKKKNEKFCSLHIKENVFAKKPTSSQMSECSCPPCARERARNFPASRNRFCSNFVVLTVGKLSSIQVKRTL